MKSRSWIFATLLCLLLGDDLRACPSCKEAVSAQSGDAARMAEGYNWSVVFMLTVPFSMFGMGAMMVHRAVKKGLLPEL